MWAELKALAACRDGRVHRAADPLAGLKDLKEVRGLLAKDLAVLASREGLDLVPGDDPMLLAYLLDPSNTTPEGVARRYGGEWTEDAAHRALLSERLHRNLLKRLEGEEKLLWLYHEVEKPLSRVLAHMEATGVRLDVAYLQALSLELAEEIRRLEEEVFRLAGHPFNLNSRDQLERVLFDELRLPALGKTQKTGKRSTSAAVLEALREAHPIVEKILQHRELTKLKNTYVDPSQASSTRGRAASTPASTRRPRPRGGLVAPTPTCRTSPSAPPWARGSAGPSWPRRVGRWWPWTIAR